MMARSATSLMRAHAWSISLFCASSSLRPPAPRQEPSAGWAAEPPRSAYPYLTLIFSQAARNPGSASDQERAASLERSATARYLRCSAARRSGSVRTARRCRSAAGPAPGEFRSAAWSASGPGCLRPARPGGGSASAGSGRPAHSTPIVTIQPGTRFGSPGLMPPPSTCSHWGNGYGRHWVQPRARAGSPRQPGRQPHRGRPARPPRSPGSGPLVVGPLVKRPVDAVAEGVGGLVGECLVQVAEDDADEEVLLPRPGAEAADR